jgi:hypothetical protein
VKKVRDKMPIINAPKPTIEVHHTAGEPYKVFLRDAVGNLTATVTFQTVDDDAELSGGKALAYEYYEFRSQQSAA